MTEHVKPAINITTVTAADGEALDALLESGRNASTDGAPTPSPLRLAGGDPEQVGRQERVARVLQLIGQYPVPEAPADLTERALARVAEARQRLRFAQQVQALAAPPVAFRWRELIAVAAILLLGLSVLWPVLARTRRDAQRLACESRLAAAGMAINSYAGDHQGVMPRTDQGPGGIWSNVGTPGQSNSEHLYLLVRQGYIQPNALACPGNPATPRNMTVDMHDWPHPAAVPFSYHNQNTGPIRVEVAGPMPIVADRNPLFSAVGPNRTGMVYHRGMDPTSPSRSHARQGQNILTAGGSVVWRTHPVFNNDNIWLASGIDSYTGTESPMRLGDVFLGDAFLVP